MVKKKRIQQRKRLAAIFVSFTILFVGVTSLSENMSIDYYSVIDTIQKIFPASIVMGCLGWVMGMILDKPVAPRKFSSNMFLEQMVKNDMSSEFEHETNDAGDKNNETSP